MTKSRYQLPPSNAPHRDQGNKNRPPFKRRTGWVRLAQREPVRIRITDVPAGIPLVSGMTATVTIRRADARESGGWVPAERTIRSVALPNAPREQLDHADSDHEHCECYGIVVEPMPP